MHDLHNQEEGELTAMRRETEKNYVNKWEKARIENFKLMCKGDELEWQNKMTELQVKLETEKVVNAENLQFLDYSIGVSLKKNVFLHVPNLKMYFCLSIGIRKTN